MDKNRDILQFLDGALSHEEEAELLHRLSVSPERRDVLRSYIDQRALFQRDRETINVPYNAEQKLWARLGEIMPVAPVATTAGTATTVVTTRGFRWISMVSVGTVCVVLGLLSGFYWGRNSGSEVVASSPTPQTIVVRELPDVASERVSDITESSAPVSNSIRTYRAEAPLTSVVVSPSVDPSSSVIDAATTPEEDVAQTIQSSITPAEARFAQTAEYSIVEPAREVRTLAELTETLYVNEAETHRMELNFAESFGKQFPADASSRNTQPIITNSTISGLYQLYRGPVELWAGLSFGSANIAMKSLHKVYVSELGSIENEIRTDITHEQTTWVGGIAQGRHRLNESVSVTASTGASYSSLGPLFHAELGGRYDLTSQVGISVGLRSMHLQYDLEEELQELKADNSSLGYDKVRAEWSHNLEFVTGIYFHF